MFVYSFRITLAFITFRLITLRFTMNAMNPAESGHSGLKQVVAGKEGPKLQKCLQYACMHWRALPIFDG